MQSFKKILPAILILLLTLLILSSYKEVKIPGSKNNIVYLPTANTGLPNDSSSISVCDPEIWKHVYNPTRLKVIKECITVSGVITESHTEADGDHHLLLKPDAGQENLLTRKNLKNKKGNLVIEAICVNNITEKKVGDACKGYVNHIKIPSLGAHVRVSGSLVLDTHNGWNEIHPISKIEISQ
ncbi:MAG: hypothetical protein ABUT20_17495 [Bacteroidota bacterium]